MALPGIVALLIFVYVRPHEFVDWLEKVPVLPLVLVAALAGVAFDPQLRLRQGPQSAWMLGFLVWASLTIVASIGPGVAFDPVLQIAIPIAIAYMLGAQPIGSGSPFRVLRAAALTLVGCAVFVGAVAFHQSRAPQSCVIVDYSRRGDTFESDGRACERRIDCYDDSADPEHEYSCERLGLFGTTTVAGRIRYRGLLNDPNELALALGIALPMLFALGAGRRGVVWKVLPIAAVAGVVYLIDLTQSRTGIMVVLAVMGVYLINRYRGFGVVAAIALTVAMSFIGGRSDTGADESVLERYEAWRTALDLVRSHPILGVGQGQFNEYHYLTAHNSYMLIPAELGLPGFLSWLGVLVISAVIPIQALRQLRDHPLALPIRTWAVALLSALAGILVAMMFLSLPYHVLVWVYLGLCGAFWGAVRSIAPEFQVRLGLGGLAAIAGGALGLLAVIWVLLRVKGY